MSHRWEVEFDLLGGEKLCEERFFVPPVVLGYKFAEEIRVNVNFEDGTMVQPLIYEYEKLKEKHHFKASSVLQFETKELFVQKGMVKLPKQMTKKSAHQTLKNFVVGLAESNRVVALSLPFHARTKWVTQKMNNTEALLSRLAELNRVVHNISLVNSLENIKSTGKHNTSTISKCTWLQKKLINEEREIPFDQVLQHVQEHYLKTKKSGNKTYEILKQLLANAFLGMASNSDKENENYLLQEEVQPTPKKEESPFIFEIEKQLNLEPFFDSIFLNESENQFPWATETCNFDVDYFLDEFDPEPSKKKHEKKMHFTKKKIGRSIF